MRRVEGRLGGVKCVVVSPAHPNTAPECKLAVAVGSPLLSSSLCQGSALGTARRCVVWTE